MKARRVIIHPSYLILVLHRHSEPATHLISDHCRPIGILIVILIIIPFLQTDYDYDQDSFRRKQPRQAPAINRVTPRAHTTAAPVGRSNL